MNLIITNNCDHNCSFGCNALQQPSVKLVFLGDEEADLVSSLSNTALMSRGTTHCDCIVLHFPIYVIQCHCIV